MTDFDASAHPDRLNLGCGFDHRDGYLDVDFRESHRPDLVADVIDLAALPSGHYREILAQDILEHLRRDDVPRALSEWRRVIAPDGSLVIRVPDLMGAALAMAQSRNVQEHRDQVQGLFGTQAYDGDYHLCGFTELTLRAALHDAGFAVASLTRAEGWLMDCVAVPRHDDLPFDPGDLPLLRLTVEPEGPTVPPAAPPAGRVDRWVGAVGERTPARLRGVVRRGWRPLRRAASRLAR